MQPQDTTDITLWLNAEETADFHAGDERGEALAYLMMEAVVDRGIHCAVHVYGADGAFVSAISPSRLLKADDDE
jgi:imidazolonepropionase-like amidohydrolase